MDTYSGPHNRRTNHGLAAFHAYASWGVVAPTLTGEAGLLGRLARRCAA